MEQPTLTLRQLEVVRRLALGHTTEAIARDLRISKNTLYVHRLNAMDRYGAASLHELWMRLGWLRVPAAPDAIPAVGAASLRIESVEDDEREPSGANTR